METDNPFEKVLDRLREKGWVQQRTGGASGPNCIWGAYANSVDVDYQRLDTLKKIVRDQYPNRNPHNGVSARAVLVDFNDHPDTTFTDVERVLEKAAVNWEEERVMRG